MTLFLGIVSQKGGVGKSTLARLVAKEYATAGWRVKIADLDIAQGTSFNWQARRLQHTLEPTIPVERFGTVEQVLKVAALYDLIIFACPPNATTGPLKVAQASTCILSPTGLSSMISNRLFSWHTSSSSRVCFLNDLLCPLSSGG
jgi:chromosome partitioning protein